MSAKYVAPRISWIERYNSETFSLIKNEQYLPRMLIIFSFQENERTEMLNHFRSLSLEATVLENSNHSLESEAAEAKGALENARHQIADLERLLSDKDSLIKGYETQVFFFFYKMMRSWK